MSANQMTGADVRSLLRGHRYCEDGFYACPQHAEAFGHEGAACDCGMEEHNATVQRAADTIEALTVQLANAEAYARESAASRSRLILQVQELEAELADARMLLQPGGPQ